MADNENKEKQSDVEVESSSPETAAKAKTGFVHTTAFKCIIVLLIIVIVCAVFLTVFNALFKVTDQERTDRAAKKIYGEKVTTIEETVDTSVSVTDATVNLVYRIEEYPEDYLINVTGKNGYGGGTVTCYVVVKVDDDKNISLGNITISENSGQSFISNIKSSYLEGFAAEYGTETTYTEDYYMLYDSTDGFHVEVGSTNHLTTGATNSMRAVCNAVNGAISYVEQVYLNIEKASSGYPDDYEYVEYINLYKTKHTVSGDLVTYTITTTGYINPDPFTLEITVGAGAEIKSFEIIKSGCTSDHYVEQMADIESLVVGKGYDDILALIDPSGVTNDESTSSAIKTGATYSNYLCVYACLFATANYDRSIEYGDIDGSVSDAVTGSGQYEGYAYTDYINTELTRQEVKGSTVTYTVVTTRFRYAHAFTVKIVVDYTETIKSFEILYDGSSEPWETDTSVELGEGEVYLSDVESRFIGKSLEDIEAAMTADGMIDNTDTTIYTGSSESQTLLVNAAAFALSNYQKSLSDGSRNTDTSTMFDDWEYTEYINKYDTSYTVSGTDVIYTIVTTNNMTADSFTLEITVGNGGYVKDFEMLVDGTSENIYDPTAVMANVREIVITAYDLELLAILDGYSAESDTTLRTGASYSNVLCVYACLFATRNYERALGKTKTQTAYDDYSYTRFINTELTSFTVDGGGSVTYTIVTNTYKYAHAFTVKITVGQSAGNAPAITSFEIIYDGSSDPWPTEGSDGDITISVVEGKFVGKTLTDIEAAMTADGVIENTDTTIYTGSTHSQTLLINAAAFALANYAAAVGTTGGVSAPQNEFEGFEYTDYINVYETSYVVSGTDVIYTIVTTNYLVAKSFVIEITVGVGGYIKDFNILTNGSTNTGEYGYWNVENMMADIGKVVLGKYDYELEAVLDAYDAGDEDSVIKTGASNSNYVVVYAFLFAAANYDTVMKPYKEQYGNASNFTGYTDTNYINLELTSFEVGEYGNVTYTIVTNTYKYAHAFTVEIVVEKNNDTPTITSFKIIYDGSSDPWPTEGGAGDITISVVEGKFVGLTYNDVVAALDENGVIKNTDTTIYTGSTHSQTLLANAALFALANYDAAVETTGGVSAPENKLDGFEYTEYINVYETTYVTSGTDVIYTIVTTNYLVAKSFVIEITVGAGGYIKDFNILTNGSTNTNEYGEGNMADSMADIKNIVLTKYWWEFKDILDETDAGNKTSITTGATNSNYVVIYACLFASANYEKALKKTAIETGYEDYGYTDFINTELTSHTVDNAGNVTYTIVTGTYKYAHAFTVEIVVDANRTITSFKIIYDGSSEPWETDTSVELEDGNVYLGEVERRFLGKTLEDIQGAMVDDRIIDNTDTTIYTGSSESQTLLINAALFALANYDKAVEGAVQNTNGTIYGDYLYTDYINIYETSHTVNDKKVTYEIVTTNKMVAKSFVVKITVGTGGVIESFDIVTNGSTNDSIVGNVAYWMADVKELVEGKTAIELLTILYEYEAGTDSSIATGASNSNYLCVYAALFAAANYETALEGAGT